VRSLRRPPPLPPDLRAAPRAPRPSPPRAPRWIGPALASAVIVAGLVLWVFRPPEAPREAEVIAPLTTISPTTTSPEPIAPAAMSPEPIAPVATVAPARTDDVAAPRPPRARRAASAEPDDVPAETRAIGTAIAAPAASHGEGTLRINTRPWTQVFVDGRLIGLTPQMGITLPAGRHTVLLVNHEARIRETIVVDIRAGETETRVLSLQPGEAQHATADGAEGYLMIQSVPWARIWLDGRDTGHNTPVRRMRVSAGRHVIRLVTPDGTHHDVTVDIPPGETVRIVRQL
jgi:hypothetical protein